MSEQEGAANVSADEFSLVERALVLIGFIHTAITKGKRERVTELRGRLITVLAEAHDADLHQIAVDQRRARGESLDDGFESTLERLQKLRAEGRHVR